MVIVGREHAGLAWRAARAVTEVNPEVRISGFDMFVNGDYAGVLPADPDAPPEFCRVDGQGSQRWLYMDDENRWRVAMKRQRDRRSGGSAGFLRSETVGPGTLPGSASGWQVFTNGAWQAHVGRNGVRGTVSGAHHECDWPDLALTLVVDDGSCHTEAVVSCLSLAGAVTLTVTVDPSKHHLLWLRDMIATRLGFPMRKVHLLLPQCLLSEADDNRLLSSIFEIGVPGGNDVDEKSGSEDAAQVEVRTEGVGTDVEELEAECKALQRSPPPEQESGSRRNSEALEALLAGLTSAT
eukprot:TRINITY_DN12160_c0_g1_i2.p1 TRINITY_DN12160_c0_g1~~TRINITY_DN12160_c0_g1_i2.p1  ORF type:complete len:295 (-),score=50.12 TRINITY_DN12160_c0_g1_i2:300-1184(-)